MWKSILTTFGLTFLNKGWKVKPIVKTISCKTVGNDHWVRKCNGHVHMLYNYTELHFFLTPWEVHLFRNGITSLNFHIGVYKWYHWDVHLSYYRSSPRFRLRHRHVRAARWRSIKFRVRWSRDLHLYRPTHGLQWGDQEGQSPSLSESRARVRWCSVRYHGPVHFHHGGGEPRPSHWLQVNGYKWRRTA